MQDPATSIEVLISHHLNKSVTSKRNGNYHCILNNNWLCKICSAYTTNGSHTGM